MWMGVSRRWLVRSEVLLTMGADKEGIWLGLF